MIWIPLSSAHVGCSPNPRRNAMSVSVGCRLRSSGIIRHHWTNLTYPASSEEKAFELVFVFIAKCLILVKSTLKGIESQLQVGIMPPVITIILVCYINHDRDDRGPLSFKVEVIQLIFSCVLFSFKRMFRRDFEVGM